MASEELSKQDEKEQGKPKVVENDGKWTPRTEIRWNKHASTMIIYWEFQCESKCWRLSLKEILIIRVIWKKLYSSQCRLFEP